MLATTPGGPPPWGGTRVRGRAGCGLQGGQDRGLGRGDLVAGKAAVAWSCWCSGTPHLTSCQGHAPICLHATWFSCAAGTRLRRCCACARTEQHMISDCSAAAVITSQPGDSIVAARSTVITRGQVRKHHVTLLTTSLVHHVACAARHVITRVFCVMLGHLHVIYLCAFERSQSGSACSSFHPCDCLGHCK